MYTNFSKNNKNTFLLIMITFCLYFFSQQAIAKKPMPELMFFDLLYLQEGVQEYQVEEYFKRISPVIAKHGLKRVGGFKITNKMKGSIEPQYMNLWVVANPSTFEGIFNDPDYQRNIPFRNKTFNMEKAEMFMMTPTFATVKFPKIKMKNKKN